MKSILVLGANSDLGFRYLKYLRQRSNCHAIGIYRNSTNGIDPKSAGDIELLRCDLLDTNLLSTTIKKTAPEVIINFAAKIGIDDADESYNESLAASIAQAIMQAGLVCKVINIGSAAEYAPNPSGTFSENCGSGGLTSYGISKWRQWRTLKEGLSGGHCKLLGLRVFNVVSPSLDERFLISTIAKQVKAGQKTVKLGALGSVRDFVDVRDVMTAVYLAQCSDISSTFFNVSSGCSYSVMQVVDAFSVVTGRELLVESVDERMRMEDVSVAVGCRARITRELGWRPQYNLLDSVAMIMESEL